MQIYIFYYLYLSEKRNLLGCVENCVDARVCMYVYMYVYISVFYADLIGYNLYKEEEYYLFIVK